MSLSNNIFVAFLYSFYLFSSTIGSEECKLINSCKCEFENGTGIDLMPLNSTLKTILPEQKDNTFYFNACGSGSKLDLPAVHNGTSCDDDFSICAFNSTSNETLRIGSKGEASFKPSASKNGMYLVFTSKTDKIEILVNLVCVGIPETNLVVLRPAGLKDDLIHPNFILYSPNACFKTLEDKSSYGIGSVLVILFFIGVLIYLFLGMTVNYLLLGARGLEVLPHLDFWRGLPSLVRDGAIFLQNGCRVSNIRTSASNQESYDAI